MYSSCDQSVSMSAEPVFIGQCPSTEDWSLDKINDSLVATKSKHSKEKVDGNVSNKS